jgi:hypothetical protein
MKTFVVMVVGLMGVVSIGCGSADGEPTGQTDQAATSSSESAKKGESLHAYARPDIRLCPSPACGGDWLVEPSYHSACGKEPSFQYVTGVYAGNERLSPACSALLFGTLVTDPEFPEYYRFEVELAP